MNAMLLFGAQDFVHFPALLLACLQPYDKDAAAYGCILGKNNGSGSVSLN